MAGIGYRDKNFNEDVNFLLSLFRSVRIDRQLFAKTIITNRHLKEGPNIPRKITRLRLSFKQSTDSTSSDILDVLRNVR